MVTLCRPSCARVQNPYIYVQKFKMPLSRKMIVRWLLPLRSALSCLLPVSKETKSRGKNSVLFFNREIIFQYSVLSHWEGRADDFLENANNFSFLLIVTTRCLSRLLRSTCRESIERARKYEITNGNASIANANSHRTNASSRTNRSWMMMR